MFCSERLYEHWALKINFQYIQLPVLTAQWRTMPANWLLASCKLASRQKLTIIQSVWGYMWSARQIPPPTDVFFPDLDNHYNHYYHYQWMNEHRVFCPAENMFNFSFHGHLPLPSVGGMFCFQGIGAPIPHRMDYNARIKIYPNSSHCWIRIDPILNENSSPHRTKPVRIS